MLRHVVVGCWLAACGVAAAQPLPDVPKAPAVAPLSTLLTAPAAQQSPLPLLTAEPSAPFADRPLPGSLLDEFSQQYEANKAFRTYTWRGAAITAFPNTLLWDPALAVKKDPRMMALVSSLKNYQSDFTLDTWIGGTQTVVRVAPEGEDTAIQLDVFGLVKTRLTPEDIIYADYRFGFPITFQRGPWQAKFAYEHTSAHIGDRLIARENPIIRSWVRDEIVLGLGRFLGERENLRVYGHVAYAWLYVDPRVVDTTEARTRYDIGFEYFDRRCTGTAGTPFVAANFEWRGDQNYTTNTNLQVGWLWRNPFRREGMFRVFAEHYRGRSPYGQLSNVTENFTSFGIAFDY